MRLLRVLSSAAVANAALLVGALVLDACTTTDDAGEDASAAGEAAPRDGALDVPDAEPACDPAADLFAKVNDASILDGESTTGVCIACAKKKCPEAIAACTKNCQCQSIVSKAAECYLRTQQIGCAQALANIFVTPETRREALGVMGCAQEQCPVECASDAGAAPPSDAGAGAD